MLPFWYPVPWRKHPSSDLVPGILEEGSNSKQPVIWILTNYQVLKIDFEEYIIITTKSGLYVILEDWFRWISGYCSIKIPQEDGLRNKHNK